MSQLQEANIGRRMVRTILGIFDYVVYTLVVFAYELFYQVSNVTIISGSTASKFYGRVQVIFGIFIMFRIAIAVITGIINPDEFLDKNKGFGSIVKRIILALALLVLVIPTNVSVNENSSSYTKKISSHGFLFGTLYEIQSSVLQRNVMWKIIFGDDGRDGADVNLATFHSQALMTANSIYKSFMTVNLTESDADESDPENWVCKDEFDADELEIYNDPIADVGEMIGLTDEFCDTEFGKGGNVFHFAFMPIASTICGLLVLIMVAGFTLDVGIRAIKLAILRLIAPIPILSYIVPSKDNNMLGSWIKVTLFTYLDLFLRLLIIYFAIFLVQEIATKGIGIDVATGGSSLLNGLTIVVVIMAIFFFARQAPKFIKDALGIKSLGLSNIGLSGIMAGAGTLVSGGGVAKAFSNSLQAASDASTAAGEGKGYSPLSNAYAGFRDKTLQEITGDKNRRGGLLGRLDQASGKAMAAKYGLSKSNLDAAKANMIKFQNDAARDKEIYENNKAKLQSMGLNMAFASDASRAAYKSYDANAFRELERLKLASHQNLGNLAQKHGTNSQEYIDAVKAHDAYWSGNGAGITALNKLQANRDTMMKEQGFTTAEQLDAFINANNSYDRSIDSAAEAAKYEKNYNDAKEAIKTYYGKDVAYPPGNRFTPDLSNQSRVGEGGTVYSSLGVGAEPPTGTPPQL